MDNFEKIDINIFLSNIIIFNNVSYLIILKIAFLNESSKYK